MELVHGRFWVIGRVLKCLTREVNGVYGVVVVMVMVKVDFFLILRNSTCSFLSQASIRSRINWRLEGFFYFLFVLGDLLTPTRNSHRQRGGSHRRSRILKNPVNEINFCFVFVIREASLPFFVFG